MNNREIDAVLSTCALTKPYYRGSYSSNELAHNHLLSNSWNIFIINTTKDSSKVGHWLLAFFKHHICTFVDSFGFPVSHYSADIIEFVCKNSTIVHCSNKQLQQNSSQVCGIYVIFFSIYLSTNVPLPAIVGWFSDNKRLNDKSLHIWLKKLTLLNLQSDLLWKNGIGVK